MKMLFPVICVFPCLIAAHSFAGSATWNLNPISGDWNTATNWTPATVPNGPSDVATFAASSMKQVTFSASPTEVAEVVFDSAATSPFNISIGTGQSFTISGVGVVNNSGITQNISIGPNGYNAFLEFQNTATAGTSDVTYTAHGGDVFVYNYVQFYGSSTAGSANFVVDGASHGLDGGGGTIGFGDNSTAGNATFTINSGIHEGNYGGFVGFGDFATAGNATFILTPVTGYLLGGEMAFSGNATAGNAVFTSSRYTEIQFKDEASAGNGYFNVIDGEIYFDGYTSGLVTTAGNATFINEGGGVTEISSNATAGQARIVANAGGFIDFTFGGDGGEAQIEVYDDGYLDISYNFTPSVTIGSLAGDGFAYTGSANLTVGSNNLSTTFSGVIRENGGISNGTNGSLTKIGTGTLTLSGASTYTGGTTVSQGILRVKNTTGSATGTASVLVDAGTLGGSGIISNTVTIGTGSGPGAFLQPGVGASTPTTLTIQNKLTFKKDATYTYKLNTKKSKADQVIAKGVTIKSGAQFNFLAVANQKLTSGTVFTAISNTASTAVSGTFANLADGSTVTIGVNKLQASYSGGDGNDLTLTVMP